MEIKLTESALKRGIRIWHCDYGFPDDFHNSFYREQAEIRRDGLSAAWWRKEIDVLWGWRALRPFSKNAIIDRGMPRLKKLARRLDILDSNRAQLASSTWEDVREEKGHPL